MKNIFFPSHTLTNFKSKSWNGKSTVRTSYTRNFRCVLECYEIFFDVLINIYYLVPNEGIYYLGPFEGYITLRHLKSLLLSSQMKAGHLAVRSLSSNSTFSAYYVISLYREMISHIVLTRLPEVYKNPATKFPEVSRQNQNQHYYCQIFLDFYFPLFSSPPVGSLLLCRLINQRTPQFLSCRFSCKKSIITATRMIYH